jgi:hypothetical protein
LANQFAKEEGLINNKDAWMIDCIFFTGESWVLHNRDMN